MKFLLFFISLAISSNNLFSQPEKGNLLLGGGFGYSDSKEEASNLYEEQTTTLIFNPSFNFYISESLSLGVNFTYRNNDNSQLELDNFSNQPSSFNSTIKTYFVGPVLSFQPKIINKLYFKGDVQLNFGFGNGDYRRDNSFEYDSKINILQFSFTPGLIYFISPSIALSGSFGGIIYEDGEEVFTFPALSSFQEIEETISSSNVGFNFNPANFNLSLFFLLGKNKTDKE